MVEPFLPAMPRPWRPLGAMLCSLACLAATAQAIAQADAPASGPANAPANAPTAMAFSIESLMSGFARTHSALASFTETRHLAVLDRPVVSSGELRFTAPDRLEKRTLQPAPETLVLEGSRLRIERPGRRAWNMDLAERPEVSAFVESVRATLAGDRAALERHYTVELHGALGGWELALAPRDEALLRIVRRVRIGGAGEVVRRIDFELPGGDRSEMLIEPRDAPAPSR